MEKVLARFFYSSPVKFRIKSNLLWLNLTDLNNASVVFHVSYLDIFKLVSGKCLEELTNKLGIYPLEETEENQVWVVIELAKKLMADRYPTFEAWLDREVIDIKKNLTSNDFFLSLRETTGEEQYTASFEDTLLVDTIELAWEIAKATGNFSNLVYYEEQLLNLTRRITGSKH